MIGCIHPRISGIEAAIFRKGSGGSAVIIAIALAAWLAWTPSPSIAVPLSPTYPTLPVLGFNQASAPTITSGCAGMQVPDTSDLETVMASNPAGTTYCLTAGTFEVTTTIHAEAGDRVIGAGRDDTLIDGTGLTPTAVGIFELETNNYFADLDIYGAPTPAPGTGTYCSPKPNCGKAFIVGGALVLRSIDCHDNGGSCIGGGGSASVTVEDMDCWGNGNAYSMDPDFVYASCIKRVAAYEPGNDTIVTNSYIHDNAGVGIWCDFCKYGFFDIENNRILRNASSGILWEMSGGWTSSDRALIKGNVIQNNNTLGNPERGGLGISTANDVTVESNDFDGNHVAGIYIRFSPSRNPPQPGNTGVVVKDNAMHGDAIVGCGGVLLFNWLYHPQVRRGLGVLTVVMVLALGLIVRSRRNLLLLRFGGALATLLLLALLLLPSLLPSLDPEARCFNNA